jgi:hypothetical protein
MADSLANLAMDAATSSQVIYSSARCGLKNDRIELPEK